VTVAQPQTPTPLSPTDQDALVKQIGLALMRTAPEDWQQIRTEFRATGRYFELSAEVVTADGVEQAWTASHEIATSFAKLRAGMYREGRGTWFNARYQIERPSSYNLEFDRVEPQWRTPPPPPAYRDELHLFPRTDDNVPDWLLRRLSGLPPERTARRFRMARIFDGAGPNGRPSVNRPPVPDDDRDLLLDYLEGAPLALPERGHDMDRLSPDGRQSVPVAFHTDGAWVWPAAVNYYLRRYGVPPEPDLISHARVSGFRPPELDEATLTAAAATVTGGRPPGPPPPRPPAPPGRPGPQPPAPVGEPSSASATRLVAPVGEDRERVNGTPSAPPPAPPAVPGTPHATLDQLRRRLSGLGVPESAYRIGEPAPESWYLEEVEDGWQVGWYDENSAPMLFDEADDAAAFLLGKLLLSSPDGPRSDRPSGPPAPEGRPPLPPIDDEPPLPPPGALSRAIDGRADDERHGVEEFGGIGAGNVGTRTRMVEPIPAPPAAEWPIQPVRGEPPLTLFRGKRLLELAPGTELDRYGHGDGNLTYAAGTPFEQRSLVPEWVHRPYHVYQVRRPLQALTGLAIPWFDQPGGGTAYLLTETIDQLIESGDLAELDPGDPPPGR
jgi:hypothetical protein